MASTGFYDFVKYELVGGNPDLQRAYIRNYDVRFEVFPAPGEVVAIGYFYKNITSAIEEQLKQGSVRTRTWFNSDRAKNFGWELEVRKSLDFFGGYLSNFALTGNYTRIQSRVEFLETIGNSTDTRVIESTRPMQGQSPYMINCSLLFTEPSTGTSVAVLYNTFGRRLHTVGFLMADIYEEPRDMVDLSVTQPLFGFLQAKFSVRNLNNRDRVLTREGRDYDRSTGGSTYSLELSASL
jgi:outer membrane receptor protein involved in Fe transport